MFGAIKPLGLLLACLPVGPDHPGVTAGANFQLPYRASFLLPHRRSAWLRFAERLDELAGFADGLDPLVGADVVAPVAGALRRAAGPDGSHRDRVTRAPPAPGAVATWTAEPSHGSPMAFDGSKDSGIDHSQAILARTQRLGVSWAKTDCDLRRLINGCGCSFPPRLRSWRPSGRRHGGRSPGCTWFRCGMSRAPGRIRRAACTGLTWSKARFCGHLLADGTGLLCSSAACWSAVCWPARGPGGYGARGCLRRPRPRVLHLTACQVPKLCGSELPLQAVSAP